MDCFAVLDEPRRPWLEADALKEKFHALTAAHHPDVAPDGRVDFAAINAAYNTLRDPRTRLRHLLELEFPDVLSRPQQIPATIAELFMQVGAQRQKLDSFLKKQSQAASPLAKALLEAEKLSLLENLGKIFAVVSEWQTQLLEELSSLDSAWQRDKAGAANHLAEIFQSLSYVSKWTELLREGIVKLSV